MVKAIIPSLEAGLDTLTPAQRLFLFYYAQCPDDKWACKQAGCSILTLKKYWRWQPAFGQAWDAIIRGEVLDVIKSHAADQAGKSFARIMELRDQESNLRVSLDAAKACLRAISDPTFQAHVTVTKDIGANWRRVLMSLAPDIKELSEGNIVDAADWKVLDEAGNIVKQKEKDAEVEESTENYGEEEESGGCFEGNDDG